MEYKCKKCGTINYIPQDKDLTEFVCYSCKKPLIKNLESDGNTSAAVGLIGGAAFGAAFGGPAGAVIGGIVGGLLGKKAKGIG